MLGVTLPERGALEMREAHWGLVGQAQACRKGAGEKCRGAARCTERYGHYLLVVAGLAQGAWDMVEAPIAS